MRDREIDQILKQAAQAPHDVDPALLDRIARSIGPAAPSGPPTAAGLGPGAPGWSAPRVALAGAARAGFYGIQKLSVLERALIFPALGFLIWLAARQSSAEMIPGSRRRVAPGVLLGAGCLALVAVFAVLFHDYRTDHFVSQGIVCLTAGLLHAIPAGLANWVFLRRGFAVNAGDRGTGGGHTRGPGRRHHAGTSLREF